MIVVVASLGFIVCLVPLAVAVTGCPCSVSRRAPRSASQSLVTSRGAAPIAEAAPGLESDEVFRPMLNQKPTYSEICSANARSRQKPAERRHEGQHPSGRYAARSDPAKVPSAMLSRRLGVVDDPVLGPPPAELDQVRERSGRDPDELPSRSTAVGQVPVRICS